MFAKTKNFLKDVKIELKKVVFPSREEVIDSTKIVVVLVVIVAVFLGIIDLGLSTLIERILR
jgi:preprotein translocase subunit SecE